MVGEPTHEGAPMTKRPAPDSELAVCPHCKVVCSMSHVDWVQHVADCAEIEAGLKLARLVDGETVTTTKRVTKGKSA